MTIPPKPVTLDKSLRMGEGLVADSIIDNPSLKPMTTAAVPPRKIGGKVLLMGTETVLAGPGEKMKPVPARMPAESGKPTADQVAPAAGSSEAPASVRLRLRIDRGRVTVVGVHSVPGAVPVPERLDYGLAYEIMNGNRRVAVGSIPDVGAWRSFPDPQGRTGLEGHHLAELDSFNVNVRMTQKEFSEASLPKLRVTFFRMKGQPQAVPITAAPLAEQFRDQLRPVAELRGINLKQLPTALQGELRAAMPVSGALPAR